MPSKLPPFVQREKSRGKTFYYFRRDHGPRVRLPDLQSKEFFPAYRAALAGLAPLIVPTASTRTLAWLLTQYRASGPYLALSKATRKQRDNIFSHVLQTGGAAPYTSIDRAAIVAGRERRKATPAQARNFLDAMRGLFRWSLEAGFVTIDPTAGVSNPKRPKGEGFAPWSPADVARYETRWPIGTPQRVWLAVLLHTGMRRGDAVAVGWHNVEDGLIELQTEKTGTAAFVPLAPDLAAILEAGPIGQTTWICGTNGRALTKESFGNLFRAACLEAGIEKSAHGLRKLSAAIDAEAGFTVAELEAKFAWNGGAMASHYTRSADRRRISIEAGRKKGGPATP
jgi:integrase